MVKTHAPVVRRRTSTWPSRMANYFDCTQWGGGYFRLGGGPGAVILNGQNGTMLDMRSGEVYHDERFKATENEGMVQCEA